MKYTPELDALAAPLVDGGADFETFDMDYAIGVAKARAQHHTRPMRQFVYCKQTDDGLLFMVSFEPLHKPLDGYLTLLAQAYPGQPHGEFEDYVRIRAAAIRGASRDRWLSQQTRRELYFVLRCLVGIALVVAAVVFIAWRSS
ncbi:MAG: hypothetical protein KGI52_07435 [Burkholderiales bacterium]|nr:hypothetical protein [Burkholderiales bacterium]